MQLIDTAHRILLHSSSHPFINLIGSIYAAAGARQAVVATDRHAMLAQLTVAAVNAFASDRSCTSMHTKHSKLVQVLCTFSCSSVGWLMLTGCCEGLHGVLANDERGAHSLQGGGHPASHSVELHGKFNMQVGVLWLVGGVLWPLCYGC